MTLEPGILFWLAVPAEPETEYLWEVLEPMVVTHLGKNAVGEERYSMEGVAVTISTRQGKVPVRWVTRQTGNFYPGHTNDSIERESFLALHRVDDPELEATHRLAGAGAARALIRRRLTRDE